MKHLLGIDIGTSGVKALLMSETGETVGISQREYGIEKSQPSYAEQSMEEIWTATISAIRELVSRYPQKSVYAVGFSGQMHGLVMLDKNGKEVRNTIIWADQRSKQSIERIYDVIGRDKYRSVSLNSLSTGFLISSLMWVKENEPKHFEHIDKVMLPKDYIRYQICGEIGTDMSDASSTAIFDTAKRTWAYDFIDCLGLKRSLFPDCFESQEIAGGVSRECSALTGLPEGIAVVYGGGDTPIQALGNGMQREETLISNIGTASQLLTVSHRPVYDRAFRTNTFCHVLPESWLVMGANLSGGIALKWLKDQVLGAASYDEMTSLAAQSKPGSNGVFFLPYLNGERTPWNDPDSKAIFFGLGLHNEKRDMIRAVMEGIIYAQKSSLEILKEMGLQFRRVIASGGGAKSRLFRQIIADQLDCEVVTNTVSEQACVGAAIVSGIGSGVYRNYSEACDTVIRFTEEVIEPVRENREIYREGYELYKELYPYNKDLFGKLSVTSGGESETDGMFLFESRNKRD